MKNFIAVFLFTFLLGIFSHIKGQVLPDSIQLSALSNLQVKLDSTIGVH